MSESGNVKKSAKFSREGWKHARHGWDPRCFLTR